MPTKDETEFWEKQRLESERREDAITERDLWINIVLALVSDMHFPKVIEQADSILAAYRERFQ